MEALSPRDALCISFAEQATRTWDLLGEGAQYKLLPGEETLTDLNLIELKRRLPALIFTEKFTRYREGTETAADWEWWIASGDRWLGLRVQAKRLDPHTQRYELFRGDREKAIAQAEMLIDAAGLGPEMLYPVYCFYNTDCVTPPDPPCSPESDRRVYGCTLVAAPLVRELLSLGASHYTDIAPHAIPWSCLFCLDVVETDAGLITNAERVLNTLLFGGFPESRGRVELEAPEHVELVWRTRQPLLQPDEIAADAVPDVSHVILATDMPPRLA